VWLIGVMVCLLAAPWVQLSVSAGNGWPHNVLRHHWLMPISCHFRDCKALLVTSLTHVSGAIASVQTFTFTTFSICLKAPNVTAGSRRAASRVFQDGESMWTKGNQGYMSVGRAVDGYRMIAAKKDCRPLQRAHKHGSCSQVPNQEDICKSTGTTCRCPIVQS